ncbi:MBL fold metallo-hydrolase [Paenibacillus aceris]|uniref:Cft2 family RNA processing exonuclease n=1 Tax=Paenibacillus aceris TaxID=869555 RepID=A0ABS4HVR2_9BACL|nr:MBL fold metallo-hydrolase [Paenibacillus aceris]MBP1962615.1 Cft2 family RNA processing exonuclease [Paenibacillus aceris]NHW37424.1 MBL fold metallo-hydrolase [Paenibacillus aceris]
MMQLNVWGGAGEHGRSCYWIGNEQTSILLDCGVKREGCGAYPLIDPTRVAELDAVFLSHAHEDHSIAIPLLYKLGYSGKVWTTRITAQQLPAYYAAWGNYVKQQGGQLPYDETDINRIQFAYIEDEAPPQQWIELSPTLRIYWGRSGHMLGSVWLLIEIEGKRLFYSGDYSEDGLLLETDTTKDITNGAIVLDGAIIDSAYSTDMEYQLDKLEKLFSAAERILNDDGQLLLPVPVCGRGQDLLLLMRDRFPETPIRVESELIQTMELMLEHPIWLKPGIESSITEALSSGRFEVIQSEDQRLQRLTEDLALSRAAIWFTSDGMMQSSKSQWYYEKLRRKSTNGILLTGHVAMGTTGQRLLAMSDEERGCQIQLIRYKIHQGMPDVRKMTQSLKSHFKLLVHAPKKETDALLKQLASEGIDHLLSIQPGDTVNL